jgi:MYXO-CTERM domain-containing protein
VPLSALFVYGTGWFFWLNATYDGKEDTKITFQANGNASTSVLYIDPITLYPIYHRPEGVVSPGDEITLRMEVSNIHDQPLEQEFRLHENGEVIATKHVEIPADGERVVRFDYTLPPDATDDLNVSINGMPAALIVSTPTATTTSSGSGPGLGVVGTLAAIGLGLFVSWRRR